MYYGGKNMVDRVKLSLRMKYFACIKVAGQIKNKETYFQKKLGRGKLGHIMMFGFDDKDRNISISVIPTLSKLFAEFNPRSFKGRSNVGMMTTKQMEKCIHEIHDYLEDLLGIEIPALKLCKTEKVEICNDYIMPSEEAKEEILRILKKNHAGHLRKYEFDNDNLFLVNNNLVIKIYDKFGEIKDNNKKIILPKDVSVDQLKRMIRIEVEIKHKKMLKILNRNGIIKKTLLFGDLLNPYILNTIFNSILIEANLSCGVTFFPIAEKKIKEKVKGHTTQNKLIEFIKFIMNNSIAAAKSQYGRKFYRYKERLESIGVGIFCTMKPIRDISFLLKYEYISRVYLERFINFFEIDIGSLAICITSELFAVFHNYKLVLRL